MGNAIPFPEGVRRGIPHPPRNYPLLSVPRIARICALGLAFDELLDEVCREILSLSGADGGCLYFTSGEEAPGSPRPVAGAGALPGVREAYRGGPAMDRLLDRLRSEGMVVVDDLSLLPDPDPLKVLLGDHPVRSALLVALKFGTRLLGFVALHASAAPKAWDDDVVRAMELVAAILSAALERRRAEDRLRVSEARYRFLAENSPDLISLHAPSGRILYASPASRTMLGIRPEQMEGSPTEGFLHPDDIGRFFEENRRVVSGGAEPATHRYRMRRASGEYLEVESVAIPVRGTAEPEGGILRLTRDVSERRRMEERIAESQALSTIGMLAGGIAHEYNNLLAGIQGAVEMLSMLVGQDPQVRAYLDVVHRMQARAAELTHQLLAYARQGKYAPESVSLRQIVEETLPALRASLPACVEISVSCEDALPPVHADVAQMKQVVMGLCMNAAEAMNDGGKLSVAVLARPGAGRIALEVSDTGGGMDDRVMDRIFEPFYTTKGAGRGMGLAAIRGIVENHGGEIRVDSRRGAGTTFTVLLPESPVPREERRPASAPRPGAGSVLLADDEPDVRTVVRAMLESLGYSVIEARDGREAVELFRERHEEIDLVLLDLVMPRLTGEAALAEMRRIAPAVRAILASGYDESGRICDIVEGGFGGFLQKPFRRQDLGEKVSKVLGTSGGPGTG